MHIKQITERLRNVIQEEIKPGTMGGLDVSIDNTNIGINVRGYVKNELTDKCRLEVKGLLDDGDYTYETDADLSEVDIERIQSDLAKEIEPLAQQIADVIDTYLHNEGFQRKNEQVADTGAII